MAEVEREAALLASAGEPTAAEPAPARSAAGWRRFALPMPARGRAGLRGAAARRSSPARVLFGGGDAAARSQFQSHDAAGLGGARGHRRQARPSSPTACRRRPTARPTWCGSSGPGHAPEPTSALFTPRRDGSATASVTGDLDGVEAVLVNTEPLGGSTTPTSRRPHDGHAQLAPSLPGRGPAGRSPTRSARPVSPAIRSSARPRERRELLGRQRRCSTRRSARRRLAAACRLSS